MSQNKDKITSVDQILINGVKPEFLAKKAKLTDQGLSMNTVVDNHKRKNGIKV